MKEEIGLKFIIPIQNLMIERIIQVGEFTFLPSHFYDIQMELTNIELITNDERDKIFDILNPCAHEYQKFYCNYVIVLFEYPFTEEEFQQNVPVEEFHFLDKLCYKVDRALDYFRLAQCYFGNREILPGIPGIIGNFQRGIVIDTNKGLSRELLGFVYNIYSNPGIGLDVDLYDFEDDALYRIISDSGRTDIVFTRCRSALARVNESYYFSNLNTSFVYLMSTLEMLVSEEYIGFKKVKTYITAFTANSKSDYNNKCNRLKSISKDIREQVVHNGKSLFDIIEDHREIYKLLNYLVGLIISYCVEVVSLEVYDLDELVGERNKRIDKYK